MKRKLLLVGAVLVVLLAVVIPLAFTGKLAKPDSGSQQAGGSVSATDSGDGSSQNANSAAPGNAAGQSAAGGQSQTDTGKATDTNAAQAGNTDGSSVLAGTGRGSSSTGQTTQPGSQPAVPGQPSSGLSAGSGGSGANGTSGSVNGSVTSSGSSATAPGQQQTQTPAANTSQPEAAVKVEITIIGKSGESIYGPATVSISKDNKWGDTVMGALQATGVPYRMHDRYTNFVVSIAGQVNEGMNGWSYKVNGKLGSVAAPDQKVTSGDKVLWWYKN